jgi:hypothetical protein
MHFSRGMDEHRRVRREISLLENQQTPQVNHGERKG